MKSFSLILICSLALVLIAARAFAQQAAATDKKPADGPKAFTNVNVTEFEKQSKQANTVILDVRTPKEFAAAHIPGAVNVDVTAADFDTKVSQLDKGKTYLVHCAAGVRSVRACKKMAPMHFISLVNLEGGFNAWEKDGKPVEKGATTETK